MNVIVSPLVGTVVAVKVRVGDTVDADTELVIIESMKMEHPVHAGDSAVISELLVAVGDTVVDQQHLVVMSPSLSPSDQPKSKIVIDDGTKASART